MKIKISIITISSSIILLILFLAFEKYSILDIDPDTYKNELKPNSIPFYLKGIDNYNPDAVRLSYAFDIDDIKASRLGVTIEKSLNGKNGRFMTSVYSNTTGFWYDVIFNSKSMPISYIISGRNASIFNNICEKLMIEDGFILKKSKLISNFDIGFDILVKETDDSFIVCELANKFEDIKSNNILDMSSLRFSSYSKNKYFKFSDE